MRNMKLHNIIFFTVIAAISCGSSPKPEPVVQESESYSQQENPELQAAEEPVFNSAGISREYYEATKAEVQIFIEELNREIRSRDYNAWRSHLSDEYFDRISSAEYLRTISETNAMRTRNIVLRTAQDFFNHVVVPSRANSRVDDIEFISQNRVTAFSLSTNREGNIQRLILYDLEKTGNMWKIIN
jgi:hypothetical protein